MGCDIRRDYMVKKVLIITVLIGCVVCGLLGIYRSEDVSMSVEGITYKLSDESYEKKTSIKVVGKILENKFGSKKFSGDIYINDRALKDIDLKLDRTNTGSFEDCKELNLRGRFYIGKDLNNVLLYLYGGYLGNTEVVNHMIIAGPADNRKEAFQLTKELSKGE